MLRPTLTSSLLLVALGACAAQADTSYRGEPLAQLQGAVVNNADPPVPPPIPPLDVALAWNGELPGSDAKATVPLPEGSTLVPVTGQFPAAFTLQVFTPPPAAALLACPSGSLTAGRVATAEIEAVAQSPGATSPGSDPSWGYVVDYQIVYSDTDLAAGNPCFPFALGKGYHLGAFARGPNVPGCTPAAPDDPTCWGPLEFQEVPMTTPLSLQLHHDTGVATPPPPLDGGAVSSPSSGPDASAANP